MTRLTRCTSYLSLGQDIVLLQLPRKPATRICGPGQKSNIPDAVFHEATWCFFPFVKLSKEVVAFFCHATSYTNLNKYSIYLLHLTTFFMLYSIHKYRQVPLMPPENFFDPSALEKLKEEAPKNIVRAVREQWNDWKINFNKTVVFYLLVFYVCFFAEVFNLSFCFLLSLDCIFVKCSLFDLWIIDGLRNAGGQTYDLQNVGSPH